MKSNLCEDIFRIKYQVVLIISIVVPVYTTFVFTSYYADYARNDMYYDIGNLETHNVGNGEYLRTGAKKGQFDGILKTENIESFDIIARKGCELDLWCETENKSGVVELPVSNYKGFVLSDEYGNNYEIEDGTNSCISFCIPENYEGKIYLRFEEPWYWKASLVVSSVSVLGLIIILSREKYKQYRG